MLQSVIPLIKKTLIVAFLVLCGVMLWKVLKPSQTIQTNAQLSLQKTTQYNDNKGVIHNVIVTRELSQDELNHITDSIRKSIKTHPEIKEVIKYVPKLDTEWVDLPVIIHGDTVETSKIDSYVTAKAIINTRTKEGIIELKLTDTLTAVTTLKKHLLRGNTETIDITNRNPYVSIAYGTSITGKEPKPIIVLGPSAVYNPFTQKIQYGVGVTFNLLSIKSNK